MKKPLVFTLFGSTGDLALRMVLPALYALFKDDKLDKQFSIIAFSRRPWSDEEYRAFVRPVLETNAASSEHLNEFLNHIVYSEGTFDAPQSYERLAEKISFIEEGCGQCQKIFYLAILPEFYRPVLDGLSDVKLLTERSSRILVEKPFGHDEKSSRELESLFEAKIKPEQLLHIDHYLAKEGYRNLIELRKQDKEIESSLNNTLVASVNVRFWEKIGIEGRGEFYERTGAILDVAQNHLLEMLAALLMDISENDENHARAAALKHLKIIGEPLFGQYEGYTKEKDVEPNSKKETYVSFTVASSDPRWRGVLIHLETGKAMPEKKSDITVIFKDATQRIFNINGSKASYKTYETVLEQAVRGDLAYFASFDEIVAAWKLIEPILKKRAKLEVKSYPQGKRPKL